ncbi:TBC1 domain family member 5 homolog A-like [Gordionus sp. m RMFG-2023]|uniref:TBC1 domain family member 5 homolog A-like n=1 Tax=Gordionus sp. m RMFG-2023 TaxID=3053472 RepID=UPI0031FD4C6F
MDNKLTAICDPYLRFPKLIGEMTDTYLDMVETYFEDYIAFDASKARTLLGNLSIDIYEKITSVCSKAQLKDYKKCNFIDDSRIKEKLITSTLNDHIRRKLNKHKDWTVDEMMKLGVELDGSNIKPDVSDTNYVDNDKKLDKNKKNFNSNIDKIPCKSLMIMLADQNNNFRDSEGNSRNFRNNQSSNNNSNYYGRNSMWHNNNNANNYDRNNAWQNNNNSNYYGRNSMWHNNNNANNCDRNNAWKNNNNSNYNGRNFRWHDNSNSNNYDRNNAWHNNNRDGGNNTWKNYNLRKQIQYHDQSQSNSNNCNMNIEEIVENKNDVTQNNNDSDFNINNLTENKLNDNAFMTSLKINDVTVTMQVDTGSKFTIIPHEMAKQIDIKDLKKSTLQLSAYDGNLIEIIGVTQVKVSYDGIAKHLLAVIVKSNKNALLGRMWINAFNCEFKLTTKPINKVNVKIHLRNDAKPKIIPPRRIPYSKIDAVTKELTRWIDEGLIEPVTDVRWASPITAVYKENGSVRVCADFKDTVNPALENFRYPLPRINDIIAKLKEGKKFSKIDFKDAF